MRCSGSSRRQTRDWAPDRDRAPDRDEGSDSGTRLVPPKRYRNSLLWNWCDLPDQPLYLYVPVPKGPKTDSVKKHIQYWQDHGDPKMTLYQHYREQFSCRWRYLADRLLLCEILPRDFGDDWKDRQWETIAAIPLYQASNKAIRRARSSFRSGQTPRR